MNRDFVQEMVVNAPIYEIKLQNNVTLISEIVDIDSEDPTFMLYYPLELINREGKNYLAKWFFSSKDPWIQLDKYFIMAYSECTTEMKTRYAQTTLQLDGFEELAKTAKPVSDESIH